MKQSKDKHQQGPGEGLSLWHLSDIFVKSGLGIATTLVAYAPEL